MKRRVLVLLIALSFVLSGCSIGGYGVEYENGKVFVDINGKRNTINIYSTKAYVNQLLESVDIPSGGSTEDLKTFVYEGLEAMGIDLDALDYDPEEIRNAVDQIKDGVGETGGN